MKICAVSPWTAASADEILGFLREAVADLVVLPGECENTPPLREGQGAIARGVSVFIQQGRSKAEATSYPVTRDRAHSMPRQIFAKSPTSGDMDNLARAWPDRTFPIRSRKVTFAICGEINGFDPDGQAKHGRVLPFDILANPVHTVMGRWQHLGPKLEALSDGKVVIHVANNDRNHSRLTTDVRIYVNRSLQVPTMQRGKLKLCECEI
jgi:hypothetical protein